MYGSYSQRATQIAELVTQAAATERDPITPVALESLTEASVRSSSKRTSSNKNSSKNRKRTKNKTKIQNGSSGSSNKNKAIKKNHKYPISLK